MLTVVGAHRHRPPATQFSCHTDRAGLIWGSQWFKIPSPFQWGPPTFHPGDAFAVMVASFAALIESTGAFIAAARLSSATPIPPSIFNQGIGWVLAYY